MNNAEPMPVRARIFDDAERQALYDIIEAVVMCGTNFCPMKLIPRL